MPRTQIDANQISSGAVGTSALAASCVTLAKMANMTGPTVIGVVSGTATPVAVTMSQLNTMLGISGSNTGDQTFSFGTTGTAPNVSVAGSAVTLNIPLMAVSTVSSGLISNTAQNLPGAYTFSGACIFSATPTVTSSTGFNIEYASTSVGGAQLRLRKARGVYGTETVVVSGDSLAFINFDAYVGPINGWLTPATINAIITGGSTIADGNNTAGARLEFRTSVQGGATSATIDFTIDRTTITVATGTSFSCGSGSIATNATTGMLGLPTSAGVPTGTPNSTHFPAGVTPLQADSTNYTAWLYLNSAWQAIPATFAYGTSGNSPAFSASNGAITLNIPAMAASSVTSGLVTNGTQTIPGAKTFTGSCVFTSANTNFERASSDASPYNFILQKARGSVGSETIITSGDNLGAIYGQAYTNAFITRAGIVFTSTGTIAANSTGAGCQIQFQTSTVGGSLTTDLIIDRQHITVTTGTSLTCGSGAISTSATTGMFGLPTCAGTPTGVPNTTHFPSGVVAALYDTSANKIWVYNGSWRATAALT